jgi:hypothetical protein
MPAVRPTPSAPPAIRDAAGADAAVAAAEPLAVAADDA